MNRLETTGQMVRFAGVGGVNTVLTAGVFLALSSILAPALAFTVAFVVGVAFALIATPAFVFAARPSSQRRAAYGAWYLFLYVVGLAIVYLVHDVLGQDRFVILAVTVPATAVLSFVGARYLFRTRRGDAD